MVDTACIAREPGDAGEAGRDSDAEGGAGTTGKNESPVTGAGTKSEAGDRAPSAGTSGEGGGTGGSGTDGSAGTGGSTAAGTGGSDSSPEDGGPKPEPGEPCAEAGAMRCSPQGGGHREACVDGHWETSQACAAGETCSTDATGEPGCVELADVCRGSGGKTVCDEQGALVVCKADETIAMQMMCPSLRHCRAGMARQACAVCVPGEEFRCKGVTLEACAADGASFVKGDDCQTAGLCNAKLGMCTDAVCAPGKTTCDGNSLVKCNASGSAVEMTTPCGSAKCDPAGADCNVCEPGTRKCEGGRPAVCDAAGQTFTAMSCPSGNKCIGQGQCVECDRPEDCSALNGECKVGSCGSGNRCVAQNAPNRSACTTSAGRPGTCSNGTCQCTPQCDGKSCGPNGCGGSCGPCSDMCIDGECVECQNNGHCTGDSSADGCRVGVCRGGSCMGEPASDTKSCMRGTQRGTCDGEGSCCISSCTENDCGNVDNCGNPCPNLCSRSNRFCNSSNRCEQPPTIGGEYAACIDDTDCPSTHTCTSVGPGGFFCYRRDTNGITDGGCPSGMLSFLAAVCVAPCADGCPTAAPECYEGGLGGVCVPDDGE